MARVLIATQPWGVVQDTAGNVRSGLPVTITTLTGGAVTVYSTATGTGTTASTTDSRGAIAGYIEEGTYLISSSGWTGTRRVEAVSGSTSSAKRAGAPDGVPAVALGETLALPQWQPDNVLLPNDAWDNLFEMNPVDEGQVLSEGGLLSGDSNSYLTTSTLRAVLGVGPYTRKSARAVNSWGVLCYPVAGIMPNDEFTVEFSLKPRGADLTALAVGNGALRITSESNGSSGQEVWVTWGATTIVATASVWDATDIPTGGSNRTLTASLTIAAGDFPANTWTRVSLVWNGSTLSLIVGNNTKRTGGTATATSGAAGVTPFFPRPWGELVTGRNILIGTDRPNAGADSNTELSDMVVRRYARTYDTVSTKKVPTVTVAVGTTQGAWPLYVKGVVDHYTGWTRDETDTSTAVRDQQIAALAATGCRMVRMTEHHALAIPTFSGTAISSVDYTKFDARWDRFAAQPSLDFYLSIGYTPAALGATMQTAPNLAGNLANGNTAYGNYASAVISHIKSRYPGRLKALSFWNEPGDTNFWAGTQAQFNALWLAVATQLQTDHPDLPLGTCDEIYNIRDGTGAGTHVSYLRGVIDTAQTNSKPLGGAYVHEYNGNLYNSTSNLADLRAYLNSKGFTTSPLRVGEWNHWIGTETLPLLNLRFSRRNLATFNAGYAHAHTYEAINAGVDLTTFYALGQQDTSSNFGMLSATNPTRPFPVWNSFVLMWKHGGTRISATTNWPGLRALASVESDGTITLTYSSFRPWRERDQKYFRVEWTGLPTVFTWRQWRVDHTTEADSRLVVVASGDQSNLPLGVDLDAIGMGCVEITPAS